MKILEIKTNRVRKYGAGQKGDLAYVLTQLLNDTGCAMVRGDGNNGFEVCSFTVTSEFEIPKKVVEAQEIKKPSKKTKSAPKKTVGKKTDSKKKDKKK